MLTCEQQIYHVRAVEDSKSQKLDLNRVEIERFPPEKLRITLERFYTSVVVGVIEFFRHITRLRSWKESGRTTVFCIVCIVLLSVYVSIRTLTISRSILLVGLWMFSFRPSAVSSFASLWFHPSVNGSFLLARKL